MTHPQVFGKKFTLIRRFSAWKSHPFWPHIPNVTQYGSAPPRAFWFSFFNSSAVGSVSQINKTGKYVFRPLCEMDMLKFCQKNESFKIPPIRFIDLYDISLICTKFGVFTIIIVPTCTERLNISVEQGVHPPCLSKSLCILPGNLLLQFSATEKNKFSMLRPYPWRLINSFTSNVNIRNVRCFISSVG